MASFPQLVLAAKTILNRNLSHLYLDCGVGDAPLFVVTSAEVPNVNLENVRRTNRPRAMWITSFPGAVVDRVSFVDCVFRGVRASEVVQANGSILFRNVKIEPAEKGRSLNSRLTWP